MTIQPHEIGTDLDTTEYRELTDQDRIALDRAAAADAVAGRGMPGTDLSIWVAKLAQAEALGKALANSPMTPQMYRGKPGECASVIFMGATLGMNPIEALQDIFVVHGTPGLYARAMHKQFRRAKHELIRTEATNTSVTVAARLNGQAEWQEFTWTIERAQQAGYTGNKKYQADPIAMLTAKAIAEAVRLMAPEVLSSFPYSVEELELEDLGERPAPPKPQAKESSKLAQARQRAATKREAPAPEPQADQATGEVIDWYARMEPIVEDAAALRALWKQASDAGADQSTLDSIAAAGTEASKAAA